MPGDIPLCSKAKGNMDMVSGKQKPLVGFIGLGKMGSRMAANLLKAGYPLLGHDLREEAREEIESAGGRAAGSPREVVAECDIVLTCLVSHAYLELADEVLVPEARTGQVFVDHGTCPAPEARRLHGAFRERGAEYFDAPISGGTSGAESGRLILFVGADEERAKGLRPMLEVVGNPERIVYGGSPGTGQVMKVMNQLQHRLLDIARLEVMSFGVNCGLSLEKVLEVFGVDTGGEDGYARLYRRIEAGGIDDLSTVFGEWPYYLAEAEERGFRMPMLEGMHEFLEARERVTVDGQGRPGPSVWRELTAGAKKGCGG